jgi:plasmid stabilization system protein ParE
MNLVVSELAYTEIENAKEYYNLEQPNLGNSFKNDVKETIDNIIRFPKLYPIIIDDIQRVVLHRFPYSIFYSIDKEIIIILSVAHQHRKPFY